MRPAPRIARSAPLRRRKPDLRRSAEHRSFIGSLPCLSCGHAAPNQAAHVRMGTDGGMAIKPSDRYCVPLCPSSPVTGRQGCHDRQHLIGEPAFWSALGIDPVATATALWTISGDREAGNRLIFRARQQIELKACAYRTQELDVDGRQTNPLR